MFNADLSWRNTSTERLGERRRRLEQAPSALNEPHQIYPGLRSDADDLMRQIESKYSLHSWALRIRAKFQLFGSGGDKCKSSADPEPLFKMQRTPTLLQQRYDTSQMHSPLPVGDFVDRFDEVVQIEAGSQARRSDDFDQFDTLFATDSLVKHQTANFAHDSAMAQKDPWLRGVQNAKHDDEPSYPDETREILTYGRIPSGTFVAGQNVTPYPSRLMASDSGYLTHDSMSLSNADTQDSPISPQLTDGFWRVSQDDAKTTSTRNHVTKLTSFMRTADIAVIVDRLCEGYKHEDDSVVQDEAELERLLWSIVAAERSVMHELLGLDGACMLRSNDIAVNIVATNILSVEGSLAELYYLASEYCTQTIYFLTRNITQQVTEAALPKNVVLHRSQDLAACCVVANVLAGRFAGCNMLLPYENHSIDCIQGSRLVSIIPIPQFPPFLSECCRILKPGGQLNLRVIDAIPARGTIGPRLSSWLKDCFLTNLDRDLRCHQPCRVLAAWARQAGFSMAQPENAKLVSRLIVPATTAAPRSNDPSDLACIILRELWKETWGYYVAARPNVHRWWWEDKAILKECLEWKTSWELRWFYFVKNR